MQQRVSLAHRQINADLLGVVLRAPLWYWVVLGALGSFVLVAVVAIGFMINKGLGVTGLNRPVMWGFFITDFVFWIGISHAGVMISAILRLSKAEWRRPVTRAAEVLTVLSLLWAALHPVIHAGRAWRVMYWAFPYDFSRGVWINIRSPLVWDPSAIFTYLTGSTLFVIVALIPDLAVLRDRTTGLRHQIYSMLAMGWRGTPKQWRLQIIAGFLLSALLLPVFVSVHSIVSWDFAIAIGVEGWHSTIFAPYFIIGAIHSGVSAVAMLMALIVWLYGMDKYLTEDHFDSIGRLLIVVATTWFFFFFVEWVFALYTLEGPELALRELQVFEWPFMGLFIFFLMTAYFIPVPLWLFKNVRRSAKWMFFTTVLVNIGMWLERFLIIVPGLARRQPFGFDWGTYHPSIVEILIIAETFAFVALGLLMFAKFFPIIPLFDIKEGQIVKDEIQVGRRTVPASIRE